MQCRKTAFVDKRMPLFASRYGIKLNIPKNVFRWNFLLKENEFSQLSFKPGV
jgi:hypothetical protein